MRNSAYDYFYEEKIGNQNLMSVVNDIYKESSSIKDFQNKMRELYKNREQQPTHTEESGREL